MWPTVIMKERPGELTCALCASSDGTAQPNVDDTANGSAVNLNAGNTLALTPGPLSPARSTARRCGST
jgi:hypothetical protein